MCPISGSAPNAAFSREVNAFTGADSWEQLDASGRKILSVDMDDEGNDVATAINACLFKNGSNFATDMDINGQKFTDVGNAAARTDFAAAGQVQDSAFRWAGTSSGTDTITASLTPAITAYAAGQVFRFIAGGTNTGAATLNLNSVGAADIKKGPAGATALAAGDITAAGIYTVAYNGTTGDFELTNPKFPAGFATTDSPQFTGIELGHATDTTITRTGAGDIAIEGNGVYRAGGTDVAVADGGTGASTAAGAFSALKQAATTTATGVVEKATQAEVEAETADKYPDAALLRHHPGTAKFWALVTVSGGTPSLISSYNVAGIVDTATGRLTVTIATDFSSANYAVQMSVENAPNQDAYSKVSTGTRAVGSVEVSNCNASGSLEDPVGWHVTGYGAQ